MKISLKHLAFIAIFVVLLAGCGENTTPVLAEDNKPTLVYIYTEG